MRITRLIAVVFVATQSVPTSAQEIFRTTVSESPNSTVAVGGAALVDDGNTLGESTSYDQFPLFLYEGERIFAHGNTLGLKIVDSPSFTLAGLARARLQNINPRNNPELLGLDERKNTIEAGFAAAIKTRIGELHFTTVEDVVGRHDGSERELSYRVPLSFGKLELTPWASYHEIDAQIANYYFGVGPDEASTSLPEYLPGKAYNLAYGLNSSYRFGERLKIFANLGIEQLDDVLAESPLVESSTDVRALVGAIWEFGGESVEQLEARQDDGPPLWSWRVHWAYQLKHNIFPLGMSGIWTPSQLTPGIIPTQTGLTLSRMLRGGPRADLFVRAGWIRHLEEPFQDDFNSYTLSLASVLKGYENFTDDVKFRWGVGFGLSYVEAYPGQEVQLFINRRVDASRLLVYLEMTADYAMDRLFKSERFKNCYIGAIITHRSGAFGNSSVFGGVNGGADWGGIHVECRR